MDRFNRVIVAVDISEEDSGKDIPDDRTKLAMDRGAWLARRAGAELRLVAVRFLGVGIEPSWRHTAGPGDRPVVRRMLNRLEELAAPYRRAGIAASVEVRVGNATDELLESVKMWDADLLVVGGGRRMGALGLLGSTSFELFRKAPCSVWIARKGVEHDFQEALAALNVADRPHRVLEVASQFTRAVDSRLHVVSVVQDESARTPVQALLDEWIKPYVSQVRFGEVEALVGEPGEVILEQAARHDADIVFIGPSRRSALASILGSQPLGSALKRLDCSLVCARSR
jgi:nucleotide-binding universal stress UspA family protein